MEGRGYSNTPRAKRPQKHPPDGVPRNSLPKIWAKTHPNPPWFIHRPLRRISTTHSTTQHTSRHAQHGTHVAQHVGSLHLCCASVAACRSCEDVVCSVAHADLCLKTLNGLLLSCFCTWSCGDIEGLLQSASCAYGRRQNFV